MCASVDTIYAIARGRECISIHDRPRVAIILKYPRILFKRGTREAEIVSDEEWSEDVEGAYLHM